MAVFRQEVLYVLRFDDEPPIDYTRDGKHVFWFRSHAETPGRRAAIVWDGVVVGMSDELEEVDGSPALLSPDGCHIVWVGRRGKRYVVGRDKQVGPEVERLLWQAPVFSGDSGQIAYGAIVAGKRRLFVDHEPLGDFEVTDMPAVFSPRSNRLAFVAPVPGGQEAVVVDGASGPAFAQIGRGKLEGKARSSLEFSPDGGRVAYSARDRDGSYVIVDGEVGPRFDGIAGFVVFSGDGRRFAYQALVGDELTVVVDGEPGSFHENVGRPVFSNDGARLMYMVRDEAGVAMVVDGEQGPYFDDIYVRPDYREFGYGFSPDGRHFGYLANTGRRRFRRGKWFAVVDGVQGPEFDEVRPWFGSEEARAKASEPRFSPDGGHFAFPARRGKEWSMVVDGEPGPGYHLVGYPRFSPDGRLAYLAKLDKKRGVVVADGTPGPTLSDVYSFDGDEFVVFSPEGAHIVYQGEIEDEWHAVVDEHVAPPLPVGQPLFLEDGSVAFIGVCDPHSRTALDRGEMTEGAEKAKEPLSGSVEIRRLTYSPGPVARL